MRVEAIVLGSERIIHRVNGEKVLEYEKPQIGGGAVNGFDLAVKRDGMLLESADLAAGESPDRVPEGRVARLSGCKDE